MTLPAFIRDYALEVGFGRFGTNHRRVAALGNNPDVDTTGAEDIWYGGGVYPWMTGATSLRARSTSDQDAAGGTGIAGIVVSMLSPTYDEFSANVTLTGQLPTAAFTMNAFRVNSAIANAKGSGAPAFGATNAGDIIIESADGLTTYAVIPAGVSITRSSVFTVPAGWTLQIIDQVFGINRLSSAGRFASFATYTQRSSGIALLPLELSVGDEPPYKHPGEPGIVLTEKTDFCHRCTSVSANNTNVTGAWLGIMRKNSVL